ncbi:hypothetical protein D3C85_988720 [compost metagenome]
MAGRGLAHAVQHVQRAGVHGDAVLEHGGQGGVVDQVGREDHAFRLALGVEAGGQAAFDFTQRHGVDHRAFLAHQTQDVQVGARFLRIADGVEAAQLRNAFADDGGVIHPKRRAVLRGELGELARIECHDEMTLK